MEEDDEEELDEEVKTKDLVRFLGMKDGVTASMASQGRLSDDLSASPTASAGSPASTALAQQQRQASIKHLNAPSNKSSENATDRNRSSSIGMTPLDRILQKQST